MFACDSEGLQAVSKVLPQDFKEVGVEWTTKGKSLDHFFAMMEENNVTLKVNYLFCSTEKS